MTLKTPTTSTALVNVWIQTKSEIPYPGPKAVRKTCAILEVENNVDKGVSKNFSASKKDRPVLKSFPGRASCWMETINSWAPAPLCPKEQIMTLEVEREKLLLQLTNSSYKRASKFSSARKFKVSDLDLSIIGYYGMDGPFCEQTNVMELT